MIWRLAPDGDWKQSKRDSPSPAMTVEVGLSMGETIEIAARGHWSLWGRGYPDIFFNRAGPNGAKVAKVFWRRPRIKCAVW